ncbi:Serine/threonine protein kinase [Phytophthora megakarya]|uniref:Serine/threonine protein kinase n=1 Tax=Phytophthora megakarya TaxID=4795 RepID=A0A225UX20_9STRA|nr:Serine/threonine protein kinase [Phytophthora megakarya]
MKDWLESEIREIWDKNLESERKEWLQEIEKVLGNDEKLKMEMGNEDQQLQILHFLKYQLDQYSNVLSPRELDIISVVFDTVSQRGNVVVGNLPHWFATSELEWFRAKTTVVEEGEEACERQATIWAKLHHPNVRKFFGACHVGNPFVIHEACSELPFAKQKIRGRRRARKSRGERANAKRLGKREGRSLGKATQTWRYNI